MDFRKEGLNKELWRIETVNDFCNTMDARIVR